MIACVSGSTPHRFDVFALAFFFAVFVFVLFAGFFASFVFVAFFLAAAAFLTVWFTVLGPAVFLGRFPPLLLAVARAPADPPPDGANPFRAGTGSCIQKSSSCSREPPGFQPSRGL